MVNSTISKIPNGTYEGQRKAQYNHTYKVNVTVKNGKLTKIALVSKAPSAAVKKQSDEAFATMIKQNKVNVDGKTSATWKDLVFDALDKSNTKR